jgi:hypothetical protein
MGTRYVLVENRNGSTEEQEEDMLTKQKLFISW